MKVLLFPVLAFAGALAVARGAASEVGPIAVETIARARFGDDAPWFERNIPFFECSDPLLQDTYYYRWRLYKAHLRDLGRAGTVVTEFLDDVSWDRDPYSSLNDATPFHLYEGRWLADKRPVQAYIDFLHQRGGNDRHFAESIPDAVWANYLVDPNEVFLLRQRPVMTHIYHLWADHFDRRMGLYFIEPLLDATEYTISSIDASGAKDGFRGGDAFRPSINSYMYANARALAHVARLDHDPDAAAEFEADAQRLRATTQAKLWQPAFAHFVDRYQVSNEHVKYGEFIRGRELAGYVPWAFGLPEPKAEYFESWRHLMDPAKFLGPHGLRTNEPSYEHYMRQYRYDGPTGQPECQWNGPSWPFQTSQVLLGLANLLNNYTQDVIGRADYLRVLRLYARQHVRGGRFDLEEDYNPDTGAVIVGLPRSHHYNHSEFCDLIITGLCGLRPRADDILELNPLVDDTVDYFCLQDVLYHGSRITFWFDRDGTHYDLGAGLSVAVNGKKVLGPVPLSRTQVPLPPATPAPVEKRVSLAINLTGEGYPKVSASFAAPEGPAAKATDGRAWAFPEIPNHWSCRGTPHSSDWLEIDLGQPQPVSAAMLFLAGPESGFAKPAAVTLEYWDGNAWCGIPGQGRTTELLRADAENWFRFPAVTASKVRAVLRHVSSTAPSAVGELMLY